MAESTTDQPSDSGFGRLRSFLWPVHFHELKKLLPMLFIFFFICFNYNLLRTAKDALVVTAKGSGAQVLPFIKMWVTLPSAFLITMLFSWLNNRFKKEHVFYILNTLFLSFFVLFITVLYPFQDSLHPERFADWMSANLPPGFSGMIAMIRNWTFTAFYVFADLWSSIMLHLLFWGFANDVTTVSESKRFYSLFGIAANSSGVVAGVISIYISYLGASRFFPTLSPLTTSLTLLCATLVGICLISMGLFYYLNKYVLSNPAYTSERVMSNLKKPKIKMSIFENFRYLARSKYLLLVSMIVLGYNIAINLVEVLWKHKLHQLVQSPIAFNAYMGKVNIITSVLATITAIFVSGNVIRRFGWTISALITPVIFAITACGFFGFSLFGTESITLPMVGTVSTLAIAVFFGSAQNCVSRAAKYTLFDPTKEMTYIPLSAESKLKGKAAIDGVGSRLGKSGGALIYQFLYITVSSSMAALTPAVGLILFGVIAMWMGSIRSLGHRFAEASRKEAQGEIADENDLPANA